MRKRTVKWLDMKKVNKGFTSMTIDIAEDDIPWNCSNTSSTFFQNHGECEACFYGLTNEMEVK